MSSPLFEFRDVTIYRGDTRALDRITLSVGVGEHTAILGPNGCGKSTLIRTLTRENYPAVGEAGGGVAPVVRILGRDTWDVTELRTMLGIVTNDLVWACTRGMSSDFTEVTRRVTGRDTVLSGFFSTIGVWSPDAITDDMRRRADDVLARLEVAHLKDRPLNEVSSGEARRLVIGRALVHAPAALVLDEVTNSLDLKATHELREIMRAIAREGTTIVLVTHHLPEIIPEIDRVILLERGRVAGDGSKRAMLTSERLSRLFGIDIDVRERDGYYDAG